MSRLVTSDRLAGLILIGIGLFAAIYSATSYRLGSLNQLGPGMVPLLLGLILSGGGAALLLMSFFQNDEAPQPDLRAAIFIIMGTVLFALTIERLGMLVAIALMTVTATRADSKLTLSGALVLSAVLGGIAFLIFRAGLGLPFPIVGWNF